MFQAVYISEKPRSFGGTYRLHLQSRRVPYVGLLANFTAAVFIVSVFGTLDLTCDSTLLNQFSSRSDLVRFFVMGRRMTALKPLQDMRP
jgi:hypothetical protein